MHTHRYYLTGEKAHNHIWDSNSSSKAKAKRLVNCSSMLIYSAEAQCFTYFLLFFGVFRSSVKASASSASSRWSKQEKELFENGLVWYFI